MGISSALGSSALLPAGLGFRNLLINGDMNIWQRGTAVKYNAGQGAYGPDRWCGSPLYQTSRTQRVSVSSAPGNLWSQYACRVSNPSTAEVSVSRIKLGQKIESINAIPLRGRTVVLSFWIRFSASSFTATSGSYGDFVYSIGAYTSTTDSASNTSGADVAATGTIAVGSFPTSWTKYTLTYVLPTNANNVDVLFGAYDAAGNTTADVNWYEVTQVQLEANYSPTPFEQRPIGVELALCQRYFAKSFNQDVAPINASQTGDDGGNHLQTWAPTVGNSYCSFIRLPVTMRRKPDVVVYNAEGTTPNTWSIYSSTAALNSVYAVTVGYKNQNGFLIYASGVTTVTVSNGAWTASAEL